MDLADLNILLGAPSKQLIEQALHFVYLTRNQPIDISEDGDQSTPLKVSSNYVLLLRN